MRHNSISRRFGGVSLRGIAWVVLASWIFSLAVCSISVMQFGESPDQHFGADSTPASNQAGEHVQHGGGDKKSGDACCTLLQNLSAFSQASNLQALYDLAYVLVPFIAVISAVLFLSALVVRHFGIDPPGGKSRHFLIANSLWPHAPPL